MSDPEKVEAKVEKATSGLPLTADEKKEIADRIAALEKREAVSAADVKRIVQETLAERDEKAKVEAPEHSEEEEW